MPASSRDRFYSAPPATHNLGMGYVWSANAVITGSANPVTGAWVPASANADGYLNVNLGGIAFSGQINVDDVAVTGGYLGITGGVVNSGNYGFNNLAITGSAATIPASAWSWSIYVESGVASVNGVTYNTFETLAGGGYDGMKRLSSAINVGCTGTAAAPCRVLLSWEL